MMTRLLLILNKGSLVCILALLLLVGCESLTNANYDHCDLFSEYSEECAEITTQCEEMNGINTIIDNDDFENNSACCCIYD